jgi:hypothetical protein
MCVRVCVCDEAFQDRNKWFKIYNEGGDEVSK